MGDRPNSRRLKGPRQGGRRDRAVVWGNIENNRPGRAAMIIRTLEDVTADALAAMQRTEDPRLREIMVSLVKHLHGFVRDVAADRGRIPSARQRS